jgi:hypothetical protein
MANDELDKLVKLRSPNELLYEARKHMLRGDNPITEEDWAKVVNFWAANISREAAKDAVLLLCKLHDVPLSTAYVLRIVDYHMSKEL